jgi:ribosomal protein L7/L12
MFCGHDNPPELRRCRNCGGDLPELAAAGMRTDDDLESGVRALLEKGQKIEAIKFYRGQTGAGLREAKDAVEAIGRGERPVSVRRQDTRDLREEVRSLLERGQKIEAIKRYRELTGAGLKEAKDAVEAIPREQVAPSGSPIERDLEDEVLSLLGRGQKIEAIRRYRQRTGADLKTSKDAVDALAERRGILVSQGTGCLGVVVVSLGLLAGALIFAGTASYTSPLMLSGS